MQKKDPEILDENGNPLPKQASIWDKVAFASSRLRKITLLFSGGLAVAIAIIVNLATIIARFSPPKAPKARITVLEDSKPSVSAKVWRNPLDVNYELAKGSETVKLAPKGIALDSCYFHNVIHSFSAREYFDVEFPAVDFLVSNPSDRIKEIQELRIEVNQSSPDLSPLFLALPMCNQDLLQVHMINEGWRPALNADISLSIHTQPGLDSLLNVQRSYDRILKGVVIDISTEVENVVSCEETPVWVSGTTEYSFVDTKERKKRSMSIKPTESLRWPRLGGGPSPVTGEYDFILDFDKSSYVRSKNISHRIKPGESDHLVIRFAAPITSRHQLRIFAELSDGRTIESGMINANVLLPRANAIRLKQGSNHIRPVSHEYVIDEPPIGLTNKSSARENRAAD